MDLRDALDFILNQADESELAAVSEALKRRRDASLVGPGCIRFDPGAAAAGIGRDMAKKAQASLQSIRESVGRLVEETIRREAPELSEEELESLMSAWMPERTRARNLPKEALLPMIEDFVAYGQGLMMPSRRLELETARPQWHKDYWEAFPEPIKKLIAGLLKGSIDEEDFARKLARLLK
jgi:hypothetical protein